MSKEEAIKYLQQLYPNGGHCWLDEQRIEAIGMAVKALQFDAAIQEGDAVRYNEDLGCRVNLSQLKRVAKQEEPVSEELEEAAFDYSEACKYDGGKKLLCVEHFKDGAKWQKQQMMKDAVEVPIVEAVPAGSCKWKLCAKLWLDEGVKGNKVKMIIIK